MEKLNLIRDGQTLEYSSLVRLEEKVSFYRNRVGENVYDFIVKAKCINDHMHYLESQTTS